MALRIVSFNIGMRGLRNTLHEFGGTLDGMLNAMGADVLCLQELKVGRGDLDERCAFATDANVFLSLDRSSTAGYSGVATIVRAHVPVVGVEEGIAAGSEASFSAAASRLATTCDDTVSLLTPLYASHELDAEGRALLTDHGSFVLLNVYCPAHSCPVDGAEAKHAARLAFKFQFHLAVTARVRALRRNGRSVVVVGDFNVTATQLDSDDPITRGSSSRAWLSDLCTPCEGEFHMVDPFRWIHPTRVHAYTFWSTVTSARSTNCGKRIDYALVSSDMHVAAQRGGAPPPPALTPSCDSCATPAALAASTVDPQAWKTHHVSFCERLKAAGVVDLAVADADILPWIQGSDHCPVHVTLHAPRALLTSREQEMRNLAVMAKHPLCTSSFPELAKRQSKLAAFFTAAASSVAAAVSVPSASPPSAPSAPVVRAEPRKKSVPQRNTLIHMLTPRTTGTNVVGEVIDVSGDDDAPAAQPAASATAPAPVRSSTQSWSQLFTGPLPLPICRCGVATVERTVLKDGATAGRKFYVCVRPQGRAGDPNARCDFFLWQDDHRRKHAEQQKKAATSVSAGEKRPPAAAGADGEASKRPRMQTAPCADAEAVR